MASENEAIVVEEGEEFSQISEDFEYDIPPPQLPNTQHKRDLNAQTLIGTRTSSQTLRSPWSSGYQQRGVPHTTLLVDT